MTRAEAIERAMNVIGPWKIVKTSAAQRYLIAETAYDAALIAGLEKAVVVIDDRMERTTYAMFADEAIAAICAEITRLRKGAKAK